MSDLNRFRILRRSPARLGGLVAILGTLLFMTCVYPGVPIKGFRMEQFFLSFLVVAPVTTAIGAGLGYLIDKAESPPVPAQPPLEIDTSYFHPSQDNGITSADDKVC